MAEKNYQIGLLSIKFQQKEIDIKFDFHYKVCYNIFYWGGNMLRFMYNPTWCFVNIYSSEIFLGTRNNIATLEEAYAVAEEVYKNWKSRS